MSKGNLPESLSRAMLAGTMLIGGLGVTHILNTTNYKQHKTTTTIHNYIYIYIYVHYPYIYIYIYIYIYTCTHVYNTDAEAKGGLLRD